MARHSSFRRPPRRVISATAAVRGLAPSVLAIGVIAGCGGGGGSTGSTPDSSAGAGSAPARTAPTRPAGAGPSGVRTFEMTAGLNGDQDRYRVTVYSLRRSGPFLTLNAGIACERADGPGGCGTEFDFDQSHDYNTFNGVRILDPVGEREYSVARDGRKRPYVSELHAFMPAGPTVQRVWARYPAPPASTQAVDLLFPVGGPRVSGVPITEGGGVDPVPIGSGQVGGPPAPFDRPPESTDAGGLDMPGGELTANVVSHGGSERSREAKGRRTVTLAADVLFAFNKASLSSRAGGLLGDAADTIAKRAQGPVAIDGYTDAKGSPAYNLGLSRRRAASVRSSLVPKVGAGVTLRAVGHGEADPVAPNRGPDGRDNPAGRARNRRVTIGFAVNAGRPASAPSATPAPSPVAGPTQHSADYRIVSPGTGDVTDLRVDVGGVRRVGRLAVLDLRITCVRSQEDSCDSEFALGTERDADTYYTVQGMTLVDPRADATYEPAYDQDHRPLASRFDVKQERTYAEWAYYLAPPDSTRTVTVALPNGGPRLSGIPVQ